MKIFKNDASLLVTGFVALTLSIMNWKRDVIHIIMFIMGILCVLNCCVFFILKMALRMSVRPGQILEKKEIPDVHRPE